MRKLSLIETSIVSDFAEELYLDGWHLSSDMLDECAESGWLTAEAERYLLGLGKIDKL